MKKIRRSGNVLEYLWSDNVWSSVIATIIFLPISYLLTNGLNSKWQFIVMAILTVSVLILIARAFYKNWQKKNICLKYLSENTGKKLELEDLEGQCFDYVLRVGIVGEASVGKTTLIENLVGEENTKEVTYDRSGYVYRLDSGTDRFAVLLDGQGQSRAQQNDIAISSDVLVILLDHNDSHQEFFVRDRRLQDHRDFLIVLRDRLKNSKHYPLRVLFLLNKQDLWSRASNFDKSKLKSFLDEEKGKYIEFARSSKGIKSMYFSNYATSFLTKIRKELKKEA